MDLEDSNFLNFIKVAYESNLDFMLIGGLALALHGIPRYTKDADIWIRPTNENGLNFIKTLSCLDYEQADLVRMESVDFTEAQIFRLEGPIDVLTVVHFRINYDECRERAKEFVTADGHKAYFIHINDLREAKILARRNKDLQDVLSIDQLLEKLARDNNK